MSSIEDKLQRIRDAMDLLDHIQIERFNDLRGEHFQVWSTDRYTIEYWSYLTPNVFAQFANKNTESEIRDMVREALCRGRVDAKPTVLKDIGMKGYAWSVYLEDSST